MNFLDPNSLSLYFSSSSTCEIVKVVPICFSFISLDYTIDIVGTCDGLVCLSMTGCGNWDVIFLWNPSTREYKRLPSSSTRALKPYANKYGFGYDCSIDDYKLVKVVIFDKSSNHSKVEVYSLNSNSWRTIDIIPWFIDNMKTGVFDDGALYWSVVHLPDENDLIIRFDFSNETFKEIPLPPTEYKNL
ncbi:F-box/kelch-repeat protein At3g06240-like [Papaver somniferum]|uniref:F-box/kelch-repeat protein At3g06240-like n=1 Tax=Papaver somniferum TaxID=3469 RepID=UPI000E6FA326|nr:F-box/kelch-repeat protein At3g06240-like [Papaver somniferum]